MRIIKDIAVFVLVGAESGVIGDVWPLAHNQTANPKHHESGWRD